MSTRTHKSGDRRRLSALASSMLLVVFIPVLSVKAQTVKPTQAIILEIEGTVETSAAGAAAWKAAQTNQVLAAGVRVQTRQHSRAVIRLTDLSLLRLGEETLVEIPAPSA